MLFLFDLSLSFGGLHAQYLNQDSKTLDTLQHWYIQFLPKQLVWIEIKSKYSACCSAQMAYTSSSKQKQMLRASCPNHRELYQMEQKLKNTTIQWWPRFGYFTTVALIKSSCANSTYNDFKFHAIFLCPIFPIDLLTYPY